MEVWVRDFFLSLQVKKKGIKLGIWDEDKGHQGNLVINQLGIRWCPGKTQTRNGRLWTWRDLMEQRDDSK